MTATKKLSSVMKGTTWKGLVCTGVLVNGVAPVSPLSTVKMSFKLNRNDTTSALDLTNVTGIVINNAATWAFTVSKRIMTLPVGVYQYDIKTTDAAGDVTVYMEGSIEIIQNVTTI